jgi:hypothetical protein
VVRSLKRSAKPWTNSQNQRPCPEPDKPELKIED